MLTDARLLSGLPGAALCAGGLFIYGFTAVKTHFIVVSCTTLRERAIEQRLIRVKAPGWPFPLLHWSHQRHAWYADYLPSVVNAPKQGFTNAQC
jgi:hypothetical protein